MVTNVGRQESFVEAIKELIELNYDAIEAYEAAINNIETIDYQKQFEKFKKDHTDHIAELASFLKRCGEKSPTGPDNTKSLLIKGKVKIAAIFDDDKILTAMLSNEEDMVKAYERVNARSGESEDKEIAEVLARGVEVEKGHKQWLEDNLVL